MGHIVRVDVEAVVRTAADLVPRRKDIQQALRGLSAAAAQFWKRLAQQELKSTSRDYAGAIQTSEDKGRVFVELVGQLPNMIENGWPGGDMRKWLLKSPKAKQGKNGKYMAIPFRHGTPGTGGRNVGAAMPKPLHAPAKRLDATLSKPGGGTQWGGRLNEGMKMSDQARDILRTKMREWHSTSIYTGMVRKEKTYEKSTQSSYQTFRTISEKSNDARSWLHPGMLPRRFAPRVQHHIASIAQSIIATALKGSGSK